MGTKISRGSQKYPERRNLLLRRFCGQDTLLPDESVVFPELTGEVPEKRSAAGVLSQDLSRAPYRSDESGRDICRYEKQRARPFGPRIGHDADPALLPKDPEGIDAAEKRTKGPNAFPGTGDVRPSVFTFSFLQSRRQEKQLFLARQEKDSVLLASLAAPGAAELSAVGGKRRNVFDRPACSSDRRKLQRLLYSFTIDSTVRMAESQSAGVDAPGAA